VRHRLTAHQGGDVLRLSRADAEVGHPDALAVLRLDGVAGLQLGEGVAAQHLEVGAAGQDDTAEGALGPLDPGDGAAGDGDDPAHAVGHAPQLDGWSDGDLEPAQGTEGGGREGIHGRHATRREQR